MMYFCWGRGNYGGEKKFILFTACTQFPSHNAAAWKLASLLSLSLPLPTMRNCFVSLAVISSLSGTTAWTAGSRRSSSAAAGMPPSFILAIRGGANEYETKFESVKCSVLEKASKKVSVLMSNVCGLYFICLVIIFIKWVYVYSIADVVHMMCTFNDSRYLYVTKPNHPSKYYT